MNKNILGLDINEAFLAAVVLRQRGKDRQITDFASIEPEGHRSLSDNLSLLLEKIDWQGGTCVCGISLSDISVRNLTIPFVDRKKINQVLSFELEDQLISPVNRQIVEYVHIGQSEGSSSVLVAAIEKEKLTALTEVFTQSGIHPNVLGLRLVTLAEQVVKINKTASDILFLDAGMQSINILFYHQGDVVFFRHLAYPAKMIIDSPFYFAGDKAGISDHQGAMDCITHICGDIRRSLGLFRLESNRELSAERIVLSGRIGQIDEFRQGIQAELGTPVFSVDVRDETGILLPPVPQKDWSPVFHDFALSLALEGLQKKHPVNFLKEEFSPKQMFFAARGRLLAVAAAVVLLIVFGLAYLGFDYRALSKSYEAAGGRMQTLFLETFPDRAKVRDPLVEMQASVRNIQAPTVAIPVFTSDKRTLNILADISERIPPSINIQVSRLVIDQESVQIKGTTNTFNNVNIIQSNLRRSPLYKDVNIISAAADKDSKLIRFELRMETGGA